MSMTTADGVLGTRLDAAWAVAYDAASVAGVDIRELHGTDVTLAQEVIGQVWGPQLIPQDVLLRALAHAGCTLLGAVVDEQPVGVTLGFLGWAGGIHLHSHMTAVVPAHGSAGVGYALKLWQRAVCLREGIREIRWTYDPMVARNAYFNLVKLGAVVESLRANFYGAMVDTVNAGDESDRFEVSWWLELSACPGGAFRTPSPARRRGAVARDSEGLHNARSLGPRCRTRGAPGSARRTPCGSRRTTGDRMGRRRLSVHAPAVARGPWRLGSGDW